jgi:hypothetical protein
MRNGPFWSRRSLVPENSRGGKPLLPDWARKLFTEYFDHHEELDRLLYLATNGIALLRGRHKGLTVLAELDGKLEERRESIEQAARDKELAQKEVDNGFPLLHEQAAIALWGSLEALVRSLVAAWLANKPEAWQVDAVRKLRVRLGDYEPLEPFERCLWVVDLLDHEIGGPLRWGVNRFECLLQPFGMSGSLEDEYQRTLHELSQVRHVLVHRRGIADKKLLDACPWLNVRLGDRVRVTHDMWHRYASTNVEYVAELLKRARVVLLGEPKSR